MIVVRNVKMGVFGKSCQAKRFIFLPQEIGFPNAEKRLILENAWYNKDRGKHCE